MTVTHEAPSQPTRDDLEALFPEARRRRQRIRIMVGGIVIVVAATAGLIYDVAGNGAPPKVPPPPSVKGQPNGAATPASGPTSSGGPSAAETAACTSIVKVKLPAVKPGTGFAIALPTTEGENLIKSGNPTLVKTGRIFLQPGQHGSVYINAFLSAQDECRKIGAE